MIVRYTDIYVGRPQMEENMVAYEVTPNECRLRDLTYSAPIYVDVEYVRGRQIVLRRGIMIGRLPIMLRSDKCILARQQSEADFARVRECPLDPGGYFIVRGTERVLLTQEQSSKNRILVDLDRHGHPQAQVTSSTHERKSKTYVGTDKSGRLYLRHNSLAEDVPLVVAMRACGLCSDAEIVRWIGREFLEALAPSLEECARLAIVTQQQALEWIGAKARLPRKPSSSPAAASGQLPLPPGPRRWQEEAREVLGDLVCSHVPASPLDLQPKALAMACMARRLLAVMGGQGGVDDRDYLGNKRLELAGQLLSLLFEDLFKRFNSDLGRAIDRVLGRSNRAQEFDAARLLPLQTAIITQGLERSISTGNWTLRRFRMERAGVTQVLSRLSYIAALGMMTRITSQFEKTRKVSGPRALQPSQWGMTCPADTPEGEGCGLVKNLALLCHVTTDLTAQAAGRVWRALWSLGALPLALLAPGQAWHPRLHTLWLNGVMVGAALNGPRFVGRLRALRRSGQLDPHVGIHTQDQQRAIHLSTDGGRLIRPLLIVGEEEGKLLLNASHVEAIREGRLSFDECVKGGLVEWVDVNEENDATIALSEADLTVDQSYTHVEIAPFSILGAVAGLIPYPHHNQSPRNTYQCAMGKQAIGAIGYNQHQRIDTLLYLLVYPQRPLCSTRTIEMIGYDRLPAGHNATVAVMSYSGYDIEDALIINKSSLDRGFGRCIVMKKGTTLLRKYANGSYDRVVAAGPDPVTGQISPRHELLEADGIAAPGERMLSGQIYVNKQMPAMSLEAGNPATASFKNAPLAYKGALPSYVDQVLLTGSDDQLLIKTAIRQTRRPELGDKFSSRHGQKGVVGLIVPAADLPFNDAGMIPDIIMNPHGFPSRMTVGKMIEMLAGKAGVLSGQQQYGTCFGGSRVDDLGRILLEHGYSYSGKDCLTSGITGEALQAYIFMGPIYYQKLKHMVLDKMHARARGPRAVLTRQPTEGRSRDGGLRLGEMERDCLIGYGASSLLVERLMTASDAFEVHVCGKCGLLGYAGWCNLCKSASFISTLKIPYACKLLFQELQSMNIVPRLELEEC